MFFESAEKRAERMAQLRIRNRAYILFRAVSDECIFHSVKDGNHRRCVEPWLSDLQCAEKMVKAAEGMDSASFMEKYGQSLERLEEQYL